MEYSKGSDPMKMGGKHTGRFWTGVPLWIFIGAAGILFATFTFMTISNINRYRENSIRMMLEKGSALIRSFEAGARMGMGMRWGPPHLQSLLTETAKQPDIIHLAVTDCNGKILVHSYPKKIGGVHRTLAGNVCVTEEVKWEIIPDPSGADVFEVYRAFSPGTGHSGYQCRMWAQKNLISDNGPGKHHCRFPLLIFAGMDMGPVENAINSDIRHTIVMGLILLFIGLAGIMLLFLAERYRSAKSSLSKIRAFSDNLVENMPIGLLAIDPDRKTVSFNNAAASVLGLNPDDAYKKRPGEILPTVFTDLLASPDIEKGVVEKESECALEGNKTAYLEINATRLADDKGVPLGYIVLFKDTTEVRALKKEIARSQRLASLGSLAAGVAHEIRNPLSSIKGFATYFRERYKDVDQDCEIADIMIQETDRLNRVVGQLLELARPIEIDGKSGDIGRLIDETVMLVRSRAEEMGIAIRIDPPPGIGEIRMERDRMSQVLLNLFLNALDAMGQGGLLSVKTSADVGKNMITIAVVDTGMGIAEDDLGRVFDPYFTTKPSGSGLGLAIVHNIIEAHSGKIRIGSIPGKGTTVTISLPIHVETKELSKNERGV